MVLVCSVRGMLPRGAWEQGERVSCSLVPTLCVGAHRIGRKMDFFVQDGEIGAKQVICAPVRREQ